ncbi:diacylglycerol/lipid kinase family protein [Hespellia stercorisuis]|uniref:Lipid kinase, YegS/Rv2252/BmrU family n=1 Tax=Hespellia stercorisuis DSM 15480 TaxID=1121950 RepID=A0A1M6JKQ6_9FIRM|nr:diacylglycerol kinase family protein [Hespellia stercorisuis]SHJ47288.1 lipid kinase, YegS/Rv2252/BmrU family [Hespellia stercorisuis DSM 15480]
MYTFIVNPHSRSGRGRKIWDQINAVLIERKIVYEVFFTKYQKHATRYVRELTGDGGFHKIIVLGGDGTVNEVVNGIIDYSKVILGYIPSGSSNDFARGYGLPTEPLAALENILAAEHIVLMDVGVLHYQKKTRSFVVSTGLGFDAAICHQAVVSRLKVVLNKFRLGKLTYVGIAMNRLFLDEPVTMSLSVDGGDPVVFPGTYFIAVMNHCYEGGGFKFCPDAKTDDGLLDVIVVSKLTKKKVLFLLPTAFNGHHVRFRGVDIYRGADIRIHSEKALPVHTDGEPVFLQRDISATVAEKQLRVIVAK